MMCVEEEMADEILDFDGDESGCWWGSTVSRAAGGGGSESKGGVGRRNGG
jgi:hypothetical protein